MKLKGRISIHRFQSNIPPHHGIGIQVEDEDSGVRFLEIEMNAEQFGNAITGQGNTECEFELRGTQYVGMISQNKTELIPLGDKEYIVKSAARKAELLAPYEVDGWKGRERDLENHHNYDNKTNSIRVSFDRFVERG